MGCYFWYSKDTGRGHSSPRPLLAVPNVTAVQSMASVPITALLCGFNVPFKGLTLRIVGVQYKKCFSDSDCCRHEVCAYGRVCYPTVKCRYGCPDGECRRAAADDLLGTGFETCWPFPPCTSNRDCGHGNICTMHYNLGYPVCQYNLSIGSSLCYWKRTRASRRRMRPPTGPGSPSARWRAVFIGPSRVSWTPNYKLSTSATTTSKTNAISDFI